MSHSKDFPLSLSRSCHDFFTNLQISPRLISRIFQKSKSHGHSYHKFYEDQKLTELRLTKSHRTQTHKNSPNSNSRKLTELKLTGTHRTQTHKISPNSNSRSLSSSESVHSRAHGAVLLGCFPSERGARLRAAEAKPRQLLRGKLKGSPRRVVYQNNSGASCAACLFCSLYFAFALKIKIRALFLVFLFSGAMFEGNMFEQQLTSLGIASTFFVCSLVLIVCAFLFLICRK